jgi:hypothetical protein
VQDICQCLGLRIDLQLADGCISAVAALLSIYRQFGEDGLRNVLMFIKDIWGNEGAGFNAYIMRGAAMFLAQPDMSKTDRLAKKIARKFTPGRLLGAAKASREAFGGSMPRAVAAIIQEAYTPGGRVSGSLGGGSSAPAPQQLPLVASGGER